MSEVEVLLKEILEQIKVPKGQAHTPILLTQGQFIRLVELASVNSTELNPNERN